MKYSYIHSLLLFDLIDQYTVAVRTSLSVTFIKEIILKSEYFFEKFGLFNNFFCGTCFGGIFHICKPPTIYFRKMRFNLTQFKNVSQQKIYLIYLYFLFHFVFLEKKWMRTPYSDPEPEDLKSEPARARKNVCDQSQIRYRRYAVENC